MVAITELMVANNDTDNTKSNVAQISEHQDQTLRIGHMDMLSLIGCLHLINKCGGTELVIWNGLRVNLMEIGQVGIVGVLGMMRTGTANQK